MTDFGSPLPNGDLWRAPVLKWNEDGSDYTIEPREDTLDINNLPQKAKITDGVVAVMQAELEQLRALVAKK